MKVYLAEVQKVPPLSGDEERRGVQYVRAGDEQAESAGTRLLEANLHLVVLIAERYRTGCIHVLDLIQKGNDGLLAALLAFKDSREVSFTAHATSSIERAIAEAASADSTGETP